MLPTMVPVSPRPQLPLAGRDWMSGPAAGRGSCPAKGSCGAGAALGTGRINRWWVAFDARYMQPIFGGPQSPEASSGNTPRSPRSPNVRARRGPL